MTVSCDVMRSQLILSLNDLACYFIAKTCKVADVWICSFVPHSHSKRESECFPKFQYCLSLYKTQPSWICWIEEFLQGKTTIKRHYTRPLWTAMGKIYTLRYVLLKLSWLRHKKRENDLLFTSHSINLQFTIFPLSQLFCLVLSSFLDVFVWSKEIFRWSSLETHYNIFSHLLLVCFFALGSEMHITPKKIRNALLLPNEFKYFLIYIPQPKRRILRFFFFVLSLQATKLIAAVRCSL